MPGSTAFYAKVSSESSRLSCITCPRHDPPRPFRTWSHHEPSPPPWSPPERSGLAARPLPRHSVRHQRGRPVSKLSALELFAARVRIRGQVFQVHIQPSSVCHQRATVMTSSESGHLYRLGAVLRLEAFPLNPWRTLPEHPPHMQKSTRRQHGNREENEKAMLSPCVPGRISCKEFICTCWTSYAASLPRSAATFELHQPVLPAL